MYNAHEAAALAAVYSHSHKHTRASMVGFVTYNKAANVPFRQENSVYKGQHVYLGCIVGCSQSLSTALDPMLHNPDYAA